MTWLVESPWPTLMLAMALEVMLAIYLVRSGRAVVIAAMVLVLGVAGSMLVLERLVVTDAEAVEDTLDDVATALETNDPPRVLAYFTPTSPRRREVESILSRVTVREARIGGDLEIEFKNVAGDATAIAQFTGRVNARDDRGQIPYEQMVGRFAVTLRRSGERWLIENYSESSGRAGGAASGTRRP